MIKGSEKFQSNEKKWCFVPKHQRILSTHKRHLLKRLHHCLLLHQCTKDGKMKSSEELKVTGTSPPSSPIISYLIWWGSHFSSNKEALNCAVAAAVDFLIQIDPPLLCLIALRKFKKLPRLLFQNVWFFSCRNAI